MGIFDRQIRFIENLESELFKEMENSIKGFGFELEEAITEDQLFNRGVDGNEKKLLGYSRTTIRIKIAKGQPVDRTTLKDENNFHPSIQIDAFSDRFEVSSNVTHAKFLLSRYGQDILKVSNKNMKEFMLKHFIPAIKQNINDKLAR